MTTTEIKLLRSPPLLTRSDALYVDFDGTLADIAEHPDAVDVSAGLQGWLLQLHTQLEGALAVVTGRRLASVDAYLAPLLLIGTGAHGAEARWSPEADIEQLASPLPPAWVKALADALSPLPGVWLEDKVFGVAVHWRQNPDAADECEKRVRFAANSLDLVVVPGHCVVEVRRLGLGKGVAIERLSQLPLFVGRKPVFIGDDVADEEGFRIVQAAGGFGIKVGHGDSLARYTLPSVSEVHHWLRESLMSLRQSCP